MRISDWSSDVCSSDLLVLLELRLQRFLEGDGLGRDHVHQRAALDAGEHDRLQLLFDLFGLVAHGGAAGDDDAAARAAPGLVRSEARRGGKEWGSTCMFRWSPYP